MIATKFLWGSVLLGGKQQINAKTSNFESFESTLFMKSVSMPLTFVIFFKLFYLNIEKCNLLKVKVCMFSHANQMAQGK